MRAAAAADPGRALPAAADAVSELGLGVRGRVEGHDVAVGRLGLLADQGVEVSGPVRALAASVEASASTAVLVAVDGRARAVLAVADTVRESSPLAVRHWSRSGSGPSC